MVVGIDFLIPLHIPFDLGDPEFPVGFDGMFSGFPVVAMPEGTIHKNDQLVFFQTDVGLARKRFLGSFIPYARVPKCFFEKEFRLSSLGPDLRHVVGPLRGGIKAVFLAEYGNRYFGPYVGFILQRSL